MSTRRFPNPRRRPSHQFAAVVTAPLAHHAAAIEAALRAHDCAPARIRREGDAGGSWTIERPGYVLVFPATRTGEFEVFAGLRGVNSRGHGARPATATKVAAHAALGPALRSLRAEGFEVFDAGTSYRVRGPIRPGDLAPRTYGNPSRRVSRSPAPRKGPLTERELYAVEPEHMETVMRRFKWVKLTTTPLDLRWKMVHSRWRSPDMAFTIEVPTKFEPRREWFESILTWIAQINAARDPQAVDAQVALRRALQG